jgi:transposase
MPRTYDSEFRRRVVELVRSGKSVTAVCTELGLAEATVYRWKAQDLIDRGEKPGRASVERGELAAANRRIRELETELELVKKAAALFEEGVRPKDKYHAAAAKAPAHVRRRRQTRSDERRDGRTYEARADGAPKRTRYRLFCALDTKAGGSFDEAHIGLDRVRAMPGTVTGILRYASRWRHRSVR